MPEQAYPRYPCVEKKVSRLYDMEPGVKIKAMYRREWGGGREKNAVALKEVEIE